MCNVQQTTPNAQVTTKTEEKGIHLTEPQHRWVIECTYHQGCTHITLYNELCYVQYVQYLLSMGQTF